MALLFSRRSIRGIPAMFLLAAIVLFAFSGRVSAQQNGPDKKNLAAVGPRNLPAAIGLLLNRGPSPPGRIPEFPGNVQRNNINPPGDGPKSEAKENAGPTSPQPKKETPEPNTPKQVTNAPNKEPAKPEAPRQVTNAPSKEPPKPEVPRQVPAAPNKEPSKPEAPRQVPAAPNKEPSKPEAQKQVTNAPNKETPKPEDPKQVANAPNKETPKLEAQKQAEASRKEDKSPVETTSTKNSGPATKTESPPVQTKLVIPPGITAPSEVPKETTSKPVPRAVETSPIVSQVATGAVGSIITATQKPPIAETLPPVARDLLPPVVRNPPPTIEKSKVVETTIRPPASVPDPTPSERAPPPKTSPTPTNSATPPQSSTVPAPPVSIKPSQVSSSPASSSTETKVPPFPSGVPEVQSGSNQEIQSTEGIKNPVVVQERPSNGNQGMLSWGNPGINEDISRRSEEFRPIDNIRITEIKKESSKGVKPMSQESERSSPQPSSFPKDTKNITGGAFNDDVKDSERNEKENASQAYTIFGGIAACVFVLASGAGGFYYYHKRNGQKDSELPPLANSSTILAEEAIQMVHIPYVPELDDELRLSVGDKVIIQERFQDSWVVGTNLTTGDSGCFPALCLDAQVAGSIASEIEGSTTSGSKSKRMRSHSLAVANPLEENTLTLKSHSSNMTMQKLKL